MKTVQDYIRNIVDFPIDGIIFRDVTTLFANPRGFRMAIDQMLHPYAGLKIDNPWTTLLAFKDAATRERWYRSTAEIELDLSRRILSTKEGKSSLRYFDGATMKSYQRPGKFFETIYCLQEEQPR